MAAMWSIALPQVSVWSLPVTAGRWPSFGPFGHVEQTRLHF
jgi:hypothetical protein